MKKLILSLFLALVGLGAFAQQALWGGSPIVSPQINEDNSVTFRLRAPLARRVQVTGDFLTSGVAHMELKDGVWEYTCPPLAPELYSYSFVVDSLTVRDPSNVYQIRDVASVANVFIITEKKGDCGDLYSVNSVPHGAVTRLWYPSPTLDMNRRMTIYTPPGYQDSRRKYPVLYLLHGAGGDEEAWIALGRTAQIMDNLIANGDAQPMIVVMTNGNAAQEAAPGEGADGMYPPNMRGRNNNNSNNSNPLREGAFEQSFMDVINYVDSHYRTIKKKSGRAICGLSMGGYHTLHISHYFPNTFDYVGLFSAAIRLNTESQSPVYKDFEKQLATQFAAKPQLYWIAIGKTDFLYNANVEYRNFLDAKGYPYEYFENEGGHIWRNWRIYLTKFAPRLFLPKAPQLKKNNISKVVKAMTLEEKAALLVGVTHHTVPGAAGTTLALPRLGIPSIVLADGPAGLRIQPQRKGTEDTFYCTAFPIATLLSSTWNTALVEEVGKAIGNEVLEYGCDVLLGPGMNVHRHPLNGRNFEYYSEDPLLTGKMGAAMVKGIQSNGVGTSIKHFALNNQETQRMGNDARANERTIREIYLKGFETTVKEAQPWTIMTSYNRINGVFASENKWLLDSVARKEWGFKGMVMTDWGGGTNAAKSVSAGNDLLMPGSDAQKQRIIEAYREGTLSMAEIDACVTRVLELVVKTPTFKGHTPSNKPDLEAHALITRHSATEGMVLLKNENNALPLDPATKTVALFGNASYMFIAGGTGSGDVNEAYTVSLREGLENAGYTLEDLSLTTYRTYIQDENQRIDAEIEELAKTNPYIRFFYQRHINELIPSKEVIDASVKAAHAVCYTIGRNSGEFFDRKKKDDFLLTQAEHQVLTMVSRAAKKYQKKLIVVMNVGGVIETASWKDLPDAILCAWQGGQEGGNSVAHILKGIVNPSGKLPMTFPVAMEDHASNVNFPQVDKPFTMEALLGGEGGAQEGDNVRNVNYTEYEEGIYVGYRHFDKAGIAPSYPFGYGLSYTTFNYSNPAIKQRGDQYTVTFTITNTGNVAGKEVAQLYVAAPQEDHFDKPLQELKAFAKTGLLQPGQSETLTLTFNASSLASFHQDTKEWITTASNAYVLHIGASSRDIRLSSTFTVN